MHTRPHQDRQDHGLGPNHLFRRAREELFSPSGLILSRRELADLINAYLTEYAPAEPWIDRNYIGKIETGRIRWPGTARRHACRHVLGARTDADIGFTTTTHRDLVSSVQDVTHTSPHSLTHVASAVSTAVGEPFSFLPEPPAAVDEPARANRRTLFQFGGAAVASALIERLWSEPARMHSALDRGCVSMGRLAELRREAENLGVRVVQASPATLIDEAFEHFRGVRRLMNKKQSLSAQRELAICGAMFATVLGEIFFNEGQFPLARQWYGIAHRSAQEARDQYLADIALAGSTYLPTYRRDPRSVLDTVTPRLEAAYSPSPAIAWLWGFRAQAHAAFGDVKGFQRSIEKANAALERSSPDQIHAGIFSFMPEKLAFYEARGWVELGEADQASMAAERALGMYDVAETTEPALVRIEQASALVQVGEVQEACRIATNAILDQHTYHGVTVVVRAHEFNQLLGPSTAEPVRDWRDVLDSVHRLRPVLTTDPQEML